MKKRNILFGVFGFIILSILGYSAFIYFITTPMAFNKALKESSRVFDSEGVLLDEIHGEEHRLVIPSSEIDDDIKAAVVAIEDANFYKHKGVSVKGVGRALNKAFKDSVKAGEISVSEGASTIPMQLAKNLNGSIQDRTVANKLTETIQALKLDNTYSKDEILTKYLNTIFWGNNTYGIETATQTYFGKSASDVEVNEAAMLAALIQNPSRYNPYHTDSEIAKANYQTLKNRQLLVLKNMSYDYSSCPTHRTTDGKKDLKQYTACLEEWTLNEFNKPLLLTGRKTWKNPTGVEGYVVDLAVNEIIEKGLFNIDSKKELEDKGLGLNIYSTINIKDQELAGRVIKNHSSGKGGAQIASTAINPNSGEIIFSIGGLDYNKSSLNRTMKVGGLKGRQPGSSIKPYVYYTAVGDFEWAPESTIEDAPYCPTKGNRWEKAYCPRNYGGGFSGIDTLTNHLSRSRNIPAVKLGQYVGIKNVIRNMRALGITTKLDPTASFPLGSNDLYLIEHIGAYAAFANGGYKIEPHSIKYIQDTNNETIYTPTIKLEKVLKDRGVKYINEMLRAAVESGTGSAADIDNKSVRGKTGTTDSFTDTWFIGYTDDIVAGVWIGHDDYNKKLVGASSGTWNGTIFKEIVSGYYKRVDN